MSRQVHQRPKTCSIWQRKPLLPHQARRKKEKWLEEVPGINTYLIQLLEVCWADFESINIKDTVDCKEKTHRTLHLLQARWREERLRTMQMYCYCADPQFFTRCRWQVRCIKHGQVGFAQYFLVCFQSIDSTDKCRGQHSTLTQKEKTRHLRWGMETNLLDTRN